MTTSIVNQLERLILKDIDLNNYLISQLNVEETSASNHFIFQSLRILNLNGGVALWV